MSENIMKIKALLKENEANGVKSPILSSNEELQIIINIYNYKKHERKYN